LANRHRAAIEDLVSNDDSRAKLVAEVEKIIEHVTGLCYGTALLRELTPRVLDEIVSTAANAFQRALLASALCELGLKGVAVEATELIVTDSAFRPGRAIDGSNARARNGSFITLASKTIRCLS